MPRPQDDLALIARRTKAQQNGMVRNFATALPVKFRNLAGRTMELWYNSQANGGAGERQGIMRAGADSTTNSYPGHVFCIVEHKDAAGCNHALERFSMTPETYTYVYNDGSGSRDAVAKYEAERAFGEEYRAGACLPSCLPGRLRTFRLPGLPLPHLLLPTRT